jgi:predicted TPR repeat methyltransferase
VLIETGKLEEARALYEQCLQLDPDDRGAQQELNYIAGLLRNKQ